MFSPPSKHVDGDSTRTYFRTISCSCGRLRTFRSVHHPRCRHHQYYQHHQQHQQHQQQQQQYFIGMVPWSFSADSGWDTARNIINGQHVHRTTERFYYFYQKDLSTQCHQKKKETWLQSAESDTWWKSNSQAKVTQRPTPFDARMRMLAVAG